MYINAIIPSPVIKEIQIHLFDNGVIVNFQQSIIKLLFIEILNDVNVTVNTDQK